MDILNRLAEIAKIGESDFADKKEVVGKFNRRNFMFTGKFGNKSHLITSEQKRKGL